MLREPEGETSCYQCRGAADFLEDVFNGVQNDSVLEGLTQRQWWLWDRILPMSAHQFSEYLFENTPSPRWFLTGTSGVFGSPWPLQLSGKCCPWLIQPEGPSLLC